MEPGNDGAREAGLRAEYLSEKSEQFRETIGITLYGQQEMADGSQKPMSENDGFFLLSPDILGLDDRSLIDMEDDEREVLERVMLEEIGLTWPELEDAEDESYQLTPEIKMTLFKTQFGDNNYLWIVQYTDGEHKGKRHWLVGPKDLLTKIPNAHELF